MNAGSTIELTAINTYCICARMCKDWGFNKIGVHFYEESIDEMKHAQLLIDQFLLLGRVPEIARNE